MRSVRWVVIALLGGRADLRALEVRRGAVDRDGQHAASSSSRATTSRAPTRPASASCSAWIAARCSATLSELRKAERDDRIDHVLIVVRDLQVGWAKAQELRDAIRALRDAGRHPVAYLEVEGFGANRDYYVASAAEKLYMAPGSGAPLIGLAEEHWFLGGLWDYLGVTVQVAQAGATRARPTASSAPR